MTVRDERRSAEEPVATIPLDLDEFRSGFRAWLDAHGADLRTPPGLDHDGRFFHGQRTTRTLWDAGWKKVGWPAGMGGLGGGARHRATYYDELCAAGIDLPDTDSSVEVIGPAIIHFAPTLAETHLPGLLSGREIWGQGFSEPDAGSDLASLRTRGTVDGDQLVVDGQKVWTSYGAHATRFLNLVRTGTTESRHKGISAVLIDTDSAGFVRNPLTFASGIQEMCESFYDGVRVPLDRLVGAIDQGWAVAMFMLQFERSMYAAQRQAWLGLRLRQLVAYLDERDAADAVAPLVGAAWLQVQTVRARAIESVRRLHEGEVIGPDSSADKILLARAEQSVFEIIRSAPGGSFDFDDSAQFWREGWWYSRATSIFGGSREIQCSVVADRVLGLPRE